MTLHLRPFRTVEAIRPDQIRPELLTLTLFIAVEAAAEFCRRHAVDSRNLGLGWVTAPLHGGLTMLWAYVADQRLAFRGWTPVGKLTGAAIFVVISLGCLDAEFLMARVAPKLASGVWRLMSSFKFGLVRNLVWPRRPRRIALAR